MLDRPRHRPAPLPIALPLIVLACVSASFWGCAKGGSQESTTAQTPEAAAPAGGSDAGAPAATLEDTSSAAMADLGARVYSQRCVLCHGPGGRGDGPAATGMKPKPRDHTDASYMDSRTDGQLLKVIHEGKGNMPAWRTVLSEREMKAVLVHVRSLAKH